MLRSIWAISKWFFSPFPRWPQQGYFLQYLLWGSGQAPRGDESQNNMPSNPSHSHFDWISLEFLTLTLVLVKYPAIH